MNKHGIQRSNIIDITKTVRKAVAFGRFNQWWTRPYFLESLAQMPSRTVMLLIQYDNLYECIAANPGNQYPVSIAFDVVEKQLFVQWDGEQEKQKCAEGEMVKAHASNPYECVTMVTEELCRIHNIPKRTERCYPAILEKIGWCTWDAFYKDVSAKKLEEKLEEITEKQIPLGWVLIDDGWLNVHENKLSGFEADVKKFPNGLKRIVEKIKAAGISYVGIWHTLNGYWGGIEERTPLYEDNRAWVVEGENGMVLPAPVSSGNDFFMEWYKFLKRIGIDFSKADSQSSLEQQYHGLGAVGIVAKKMHTQLDHAAEIYFDGTLINCMGMSPEDVFARPHSAVSRNSDDFVPKREGGFEEHLLQNAFNSLYHNQIYYCDWDMFWSSHPEAGKHALIRALSGGPIYISDPVGKTDKKIIDRLCYSDGTALRVDYAAIPTADCLFCDPKDCGYLKIFTECNQTVCVGIFSFSDIPVKTKVELPIKPRAKEYIVTDPINRESILLKVGESFYSEIPERGYRYFLFTPVWDGVAVIGNLDKYVASHTVQSSSRISGEVQVALREGGVFAFYSETAVREVYVNSTKHICERYISKAEKVTFMNAGGKPISLTDNIYLLLCEKRQTNIEIIF